MDNNNEGPSCHIGLGSYTGGQLWAVYRKVRNEKRAGRCLTDLPSETPPGFSSISPHATEDPAGMEGGRRVTGCGGRRAEREESFFSSSIVGMIHGSRLAADAKEDASGSPQAQAP